MQTVKAEDLVITPSADDSQKNFNTPATDSPVRFTQEHICENSPDVDYTRYVRLLSVPSVHWCSFEAGPDLLGILWCGQSNTRRR